MRVLMIAGLMVAVLMGGQAFADDLTVVEDPTGFFYKAKAVIDQLEPREGVYWDLKDDDLKTFFGARLLSKDIKGYTVDGVIGYSVDKTVVGALEIDLLQTVANLTGADWQADWIELHSGPAVGYDDDDNELSYGITADATFKF